MKTWIEAWNAILPLSTPLRSNRLYSIPPHFILFHSATLLSTSLHSTQFHLTPFHSISFRSTPLHSTPLHSTPLHSTASLRTFLSTARESGRLNLAARAGENYLKLLIFFAILIYFSLKFWRKMNFQNFSFFSFFSFFSLWYKWEKWKTWKTLWLSWRSFT